MIPDFDHNHVTPPHIGDPRKRDEISPYHSDTLEFVTKFGTSIERVEILKGFLRFRERLNEVGVLEGFQWLDGSFTENIEISENRAPRDLDLVTFYNLSILNEGQKKEINDNFTEFFDVDKSKANYKLDHYPFNYTHLPELTVRYSTYWIQLFSHNRLGVWKGIIKVDLNTPDIDQQAIEYLTNLAL
ncbi:hypothetical protein F0358_10485 [Empedobacter brevis]|uniref:DUF6932 family protein n=1 Tax=Empedobacter brevis TaxID=247 RepID=UPI00123D11E2|nr:hypothetical protein [Empedobacter brevis]QES93101.1 hypothetical protein F0358_10485 [Empedobacter brevis]